MKPLIRLPSAICTFLVCVLPLACPPTVQSAESANVTRYRQQSVWRGARTLPILARLSYRRAVEELKRGDVEKAEEHLRRALEYDPAFPDSYFTLARVRARQFDIEAPVYLFLAFASVAKNFTFQTLLVTNGVVATPYVLLLITLILCFALGVKYLPFMAHKLREILDMRFHAFLPSLATYMVILVPLVLLPGVITALAYLIVACWLFMYRRERVLIIALITPFILLGLFGSHLTPIAPIVDPHSLTSLVARANNSPGDAHLIRALKRHEIPELEPERNLALGLMYHRNRDYANASDHFLQAIAADPQNPMGYINLGNVYFMQGQYEKALEGYRKAEELAPKDPVCQHALAQAYIKTLLMQEASDALQLASSLGIEDVKATYAEGAAKNLAVLPKTFSNLQLWRIAAVEGKSHTHDFINEVLQPLTRFPRNVSAWILLGALAVGMILSRIVNVSKLTFQCANCGRLICRDCCNSERETDLCQTCAQAIQAVTSEKVVEALLRQKRQAAIVARRKSSRFITMVLPGVRDIFYGNVSRGFVLAALFSFSVVQLITKGLALGDPAYLADDTPLWKTILPVTLLAVTYLMSLRAKQNFVFRPRRGQTVKPGVKGPSGEGAASRVA